MSATVSSSFMAIRPKVSRMSLRRGDRIRVAVRAFRVHVDEAHLHGCERVFEIASVHLAVRVVVGNENATSLFHAFGTVGVAHVAAKPCGLAAPIHVLIGFPGVLASTGEAERFEAHCLESDVAREDEEIGPGRSCGRTSA